MKETIDQQNTRRDEPIRSHYLPRAFPKSAQSDRMYVPLEHVTRKIKFCLQ
jgi:hypothetical protein